MIIVNRNNNYAEENDWDIRLFLDFAEAEQASFVFLHKVRASPSGSDYRDYTALSVLMHRAV